MNPTTEANATLVAEDQKELTQIVTQNGLHADTALSLQSSFAPLFQQARTVIEKSRAIVVTDASQKLEIKLARAHRLELKSIRVAAEKTRKELKEEYVRGGRAVDGFNNILLHLTQTEEKRLEDQEQFAERQEAARKLALKESREKILLTIQADPNLFQLGEMTEETFNQLVEGTKLARAAEQERKRKEEADRIEREAKEAAERERIRAENERLKREADEREAAEKAERQRKAELHWKRLQQIKPLIDSGDESQNQTYGELTDEQFSEAMAGAENRREQRLKLEREKAETAAAAQRDRERLEAVAAEERKKAADAAEQARREREAAEAKRKEIEAENTRKLAEQKRIAEEAAAAEKARVEKEKAAAAELARKEKEQADKRAESQRLEKERIEAELKAERDAQAKRKADAEEAERKAAAAPDRDRLLNYANAIRALEIPTFTTPAAKAIATTIAASRDKFANWCDEKAGAL